MIGIKNSTGLAGEIVRYLSARMNLSERGATAVEYGMIVALIAAVIVVVVGQLGQDVQSGFDTVHNELAPAVP